MVGRRTVPDGSEQRWPGLETPGPGVLPDKQCDDLTICPISGRPLQERENPEPGISR